MGAALMKVKNTLLIVVIAIILTSLVGDFVVQKLALFDYGGVEEGMSFAEYEQLIPEDQRFDYHGFSFYMNEANYPVIFKWSEEQRVAEIKSYDPANIKTSTSNFEKLEKGMSLYEVAATVGLPVGSESEDGYILRYWASGGVEYNIRYTLTDGMFYLDSVVKIEADG